MPQPLPTSLTFSSVPCIYSTNQSDDNDKKKSKHKHKQLIRRTKISGSIQNRANQNYIFFDEYGSHGSRTPDQTKQQTNNQTNKPIIFLVL